MYKRSTWAVDRKNLAATILYYSPLCSAGGRFSAVRQTASQVKSATRIHIVALAGNKYCQNRSDRTWFTETAKV